MLDAGPRNVQSAMERELQRCLKEYVVTLRTPSLKKREHRDWCWVDRTLQLESWREQTKACCCSKRGEGWVGGSRESWSWDIEVCVKPRRCSGNAHQIWSMGRAFASRLMQCSLIIIACVFEKWTITLHIFRAIHTCATIISKTNNKAGS